jgi:hypothetical protein
MADAQYAGAVCGPALNGAGAILPEGVEAAGAGGTTLIHGSVQFCTYGKYPAGCVQ